MSFGNGIGCDIKITEDLLFDLSYGSFIVEADTLLDNEFAIYLGKTINDNLIINNEVITIEEAFQCNRKRFTAVYKDKLDTINDKLNLNCFKANEVKTLNNKDEVKVFIPVFPGTNCDYDTAKAFRRAKALVESFVFRNLTTEDINYSIEQMALKIDEADIFVLSGGFSAGDEPDGSGKFIACVLNNELIKSAINRLIARRGLILGICNGFQALIKSGLLPDGKIGEVTKNSPTLFRNDINRHVSQIVSTKVMSNNSPWLKGYETGEIHSIAVSHGEGKFVVSDELAKSYLPMVR